MGSNSFGTIFRITTWGESHGKAIGVVIDGCPANLPISEEEVNRSLLKRAPGKSPYTSPRKEEDLCEILSGVFEGKTTGAPISLIIYNKDADSSKYDEVRALYKPGHAGYTYLEKYGNFDHRGSGRASARETACRVAAGAVAKKLLQHVGITLSAELLEVGGKPVSDMEQLLTKAISSGDSLGGVVGFSAKGLPTGLGDPIYEKLEAKLALAMLSIPASKGFEIGEGFFASSMLGSTHNDAFAIHDGNIRLNTNHAGGTLGGISTGDELYGRVAFKPTSSIQIEQETVDFKAKKNARFKLPKGSRHDPCVAIRAVPVVEAMLSLVLADLCLMNLSSKL